MSKIKPPEWHLEKRKLSKLKEYPFNPRTLTEEQEEQIKHKLETYGVIDRPCVTIEGMIIGGHQRTKILKKLGVKELEVWVPDRELSDKEISKLNLSLNKVSGDFDYDIIKSMFEKDDLLDAGWSDEEASDLWNLPSFISEDEDEIIEEKKDIPKEDVDTLKLKVKFIITIPNEEAASFENQLDQLIVKFPTAKKEKKA